MACISETETTGPDTRAMLSLGADKHSVGAAIVCGALVVSDLRLENDLVCPGDGLIVNADDIKINLDSHSITGAGAGIGITLRGET